MARPGDVVVAPSEDRFTVRDATTHELLSGPFAREAYAVGVAQSIAWKRRGRVLRDSDEENTSIPLTSGTFGNTGGH